LEAQRRQELADLLVYLSAPAVVEPEEISGQEPLVSFLRSV